MFRALSSIGLQALQERSCQGCRCRDVRADGCSTLPGFSLNRCRQDGYLCFLYRSILPQAGQNGKPQRVTSLSLSFIAPTLPYIPCDEACIHLVSCNVLSLTYVSG